MTMRCAQRLSAINGQSRRTDGRASRSRTVLNAFRQSTDNHSLMVFQNEPTHTVLNAFRQSTDNHPQLQIQTISFYCRAQRLSAINGQSQALIPLLCRRSRVLNAFRQSTDNHVAAGFYLVPNTAVLNAFRQSTDNHVRDGKLGFT